MSRHWTAADRLKIHDAVKSGKTSEQLAAEFEVSVGSIRTIINRHGLSSGRQTRDCMKCRKPFGSEWIGNRRCAACIREGEKYACN